MNPCIFCSIIAGEAGAEVVLRTEHTVAFLDRTPVFHGHVLVVPVAHVETLIDMPPTGLGPLFADVQRVAQAVETGLGAAGSFVAMNNRISQSVAHLHVHVVPRNRKDGLRGFFWPRVKYHDAGHMAEFGGRLRAALDGY